MSVSLQEEIKSRVNKHEYIDFTKNVIVTW